MRSVLCVMAFAACGRIDFDPRPNYTGTTGLRCQKDSDCGPCQRCTSNVCGTTEPIHDVFLGHRETCFLGDGGSRWYVGENTGLGMPNEVPPSMFPARIPGDDGWTTLALGWGGNLGVRNGELWQWENATSVPSQVSVDADWAEIKIGVSQPACLRRSDGELTCAGKIVEGSWARIAVGQHFCGIQTDGSLWCWGPNTANALGLGVVPAGTEYDVPQRVGADTDWVDIAVGEGLSCGRRTDNTLWCWGHPDRTGTARVDTMGVPTQISSDTDWTWLDVHWVRACAGKPNGELYCWGTEDLGDTVLPGMRMVEVPTPLVGYTFERVLLGGHHWCGRIAGTWYCWGWNAAGQLALGDDANRDQPTDPMCTPAR